MIVDDLLLNGVYVCMSAMVVKELASKSRSDDLAWITRKVADRKSPIIGENAQHTEDLRNLLGFENYDCFVRLANFFGRERVVVLTGDVQIGLQLDIEGITHGDLLTSLSY